MTITEFIKMPSAKYSAMYASAFMLSFISSKAVFSDYLDFVNEGKSDPIPFSTSKNTSSFQDEVNALSSRLVVAYRLNPERAGRFAGWILEAEAYTHVHVDLIATIIMTESSFRYSAVSIDGAVGPTQVKPKYWSSSCGDLKNPRDNIICGAHVLSQYLKIANGNVKQAIKMYNVGPSNLKHIEYKASSERYYGKVAVNLAMLNNPGVIIR